MLAIKEPRFSRQAESLINSLKEFNKEDFYNWFYNDYMSIIGDGHILKYVLIKQMEDKK
jgi:hypothetical protein